MDFLKKVISIFDYFFRNSHLGCTFDSNLAKHKTEKYSISISISPSIFQHFKCIWDLEGILGTTVKSYKVSRTAELMGRLFPACSVLGFLVHPCLTVLCKIAWSWTAGRLLLAGSTKQLNVPCLKGLQCPKTAEGNDNLLLPLRFFKGFVTILTTISFFCYYYFTAIGFSNFCRFPKFGEGGVKRPN